MPNNETGRHSLFFTLFRRPLPLERETSVFILVNALDVFMTYVLMRLHGFAESNPVALVIFYRWNIAGLVFFKFAFVTLVCLIAQVVAARRIETARRLLKFVTVIVACVVVYGFVLLLRRIGSVTL